MPGDPAPLTKQELFSRLGEGHAADITVVTPNRRLTRALRAEFDLYQATKGLPSWDDADMLPLPALAARLYEEATYAEAAALPRLLAPAEEQALWESVLEDSGLLAVPRAAADCRGAWALAHRWRIDGALGAFPGNEDAAAFAGWAREYARRCARGGHTDTARLPDLLASLLAGGALAKPKVLVAYAFDVLPPQARDFLDVLSRCGVQVLTSGPERRSHSRTWKRIFSSPREELEVAAQWARAKLEGGAKRIGVVVPELGQRRKEVVRVFSAALDPGYALPGRERRALPFGVSLGAPLGDWPLVSAALSILELVAGDIPFEQASRLVRSPFVAGAGEELAARARLDARLRKGAPPRLSLGKLAALAQGCPLLRRRLEALYDAVPRRERAAPHAWGRHFSALLEAAGFPGRALDSAEFQVLRRFEELLAEFAGLGVVAESISFPAALAKLKFLCEDSQEHLFQPESAGAPIEVLGALESAGQEFDALWVSGLTDEAWPLHAAPNPFLPPALQRKAGIPEASPEESLVRARRITAGWLGAAAEVVVSLAARDGDRELIASPLIAGIPLSPDLPQARARYRDVLFRARKIERIADGKAPAFAGTAPRGGTAVLKDQAACPFRAFARHRLGAERLEEAVDGLDARARGSLLHALMKPLWEELKGSDALERDCEAAIARAARAAVEELGLEEPLAGLERQRLARLARAWLAIEKERRPFEVEAVERKVPLAVAGLQLQGRIDRLDLLASGGYAVIDYKGGRPKVAQWMGERPEEPQLPLYAVGVPEEVAAVAFAQLKTGEMRFVGCSREKDEFPGVKPRDNWPGLIAAWRVTVEALGAGFASGEARVDPKKLVHTCRYCDLQPLCRVYERINVLAEEEGEAE